MRRIVSYQARKQVFDEKGDGLNLKLIFFQKTDYSCGGLGLETKLFSPRKFVIFSKNVAILTSFGSYNSLVCFESRLEQLNGKS